MAVPNITDVRNFINQLDIRCNKDISNILDAKKERLNTVKSTYVLTNPLATFEIKEQKLDTLINKLNDITKHNLDISIKKLDTLKNNYTLNNPDSIISTFNNTYELLLNKLDLLNPLNVLKKGYSVTTKDNKTIKNIKDIKINDKINIKLHKGNIDAIVERINK